MIRLSASSVPRALACPASLVLPQTKYHTDFADQGEDRHADFEAAIDVGDAGDVLPEQVLAMLKPGDRHVTEASWAYDVVTDRARELGHIPRREYAKNLQATEIGGTCDLVIIGNGRAIIVDKKGFKRVGSAETNEQTLTYAVMIAKTYDLDEVTVVIFYELGACSIATLGLIEIENHARRLRQLLVDVAAAKANPLAWLNVNQHCEYCEAFLHCPKQSEFRAEMTKADTVMAIESRIPFESDADAADAFDLWQRLKLLTNRVGAALHARAGEREFVLNDGRVFGPREKQGNLKLDGEKVWQLLNKQYGPRIADQSVRRVATQKHLEEALKMTGKPVAPQKKKVIDELKARGGATQTTKTVVEVYEPQKVLKEGTG